VPWKPSVTVAAVIERDGRFLLVEEETAEGVRLNQPAGHLDPGESLTTAAARETLEETAFAFTPKQLIGVYLWRSPPPPDGNGVTYLRFAFCGELGAHDGERALDAGILRALWLTREEIAARAAEHRSPLVQRCIDDFLGGARYPLDLLFTHPSAVAPVVTSTVTPALVSAFAPADPPAVAPAQAGAQVHGMDRAHGLQVRPGTWFTGEYGAGARRTPRCRGRRPVPWKNAMPSLMRG
jgi:8-oxo-dGTP pyrophosphatase MutT (NUDIX family)